jgi:transposase
MAKKGQQQRKYSAEFKIGVIMDMREHRLGYCETVRKYWPVTGNNVDNYKNAVKRWERIFLEEGAEGLMKERRGRACVASGTRKGRPPKLDPKIEEDLIAENQRLRMEIEYLKKLDALVREREERENARKQK